MVIRSKHGIQIHGLRKGLREGLGMGMGLDGGRLELGGVMELFIVETFGNVHHG